MSYKMNLLVDTSGLMEKISIQRNENFEKPKNY